jgi:hypothetical protein
MPVGSSDVANLANTSNGTADETAAKVADGLQFGQNTGGPGAVNAYTGVVFQDYYILMENSGFILLEDGIGYIQLEA